MALSSKAVVIYFLSLTAVVIRAGPSIMKLLRSRENSTYMNITFTDMDLQELYLCMGAESTAVCLIQVHVIDPQDGLVTSIQRRQEDVNGTRWNYFTCTYMPTDMHVVCNRQDTAACMNNTPRTPSHVDNPCCHNSCIWLLWNDAQEQLYGNHTIEICNLNCTRPGAMPINLPTTRLMNETTLGHEPGNRVTKDAGTSEYHHSPSVIVSVVVASIIAIDIIIVTLCVLYNKCHDRRQSGDIKVTDKETPNTDSLRTLTADLPGLYANTDQTRVYSSLEFLDGAAAEQHVYDKMDDSCNSQLNAEESNKQIYENTEPCKPTEGIHNSSDITNTKQRNEDIDRAYSTIEDCYATMEDFRDESEVNRSMADFTTESTYVDLNDESAGDLYINGDTEMDDSQRNDSNTRDRNIYVNTEVCVHSEAQSSSVNGEAQSSSVNGEAQSSSVNGEAQSSSVNGEGQSSNVEDDNVYTSTPERITTRF